MEMSRQGAAFRTGRDGNFINSWSQLRVMPENPLQAFYATGDALLAMAPHNVLLVLFSGGARPRVIHSPSERGALTYLRGDFFAETPLPGPA